MQEAAAFMQDHPLGGENPQINVWNGGLGSDHKTWLAHVLSEAARYNCTLCFDVKLHMFGHGCLPAALAIKMGNSQ